MKLYSTPQVVILRLTQDLISTSGEPMFATGENFVFDTLVD